MLRPRPIIVFSSIFGQVCLKTKQTSALKIFNLFHGQAAEGAVNVTCFGWKYLVKLASLLCLTIYRMEREYVAAKTTHAAC